MRIDRRRLLLSCAAPLLDTAATPAAALRGRVRGLSLGVHNRLAICSETFAGKNFAEACKAVRRTG